MMITFTCSAYCCDRTHFFALCVPLFRKMRHFMSSTKKKTQVQKEDMKAFVVEVVKMFFLAVIIIVPVRVFLFQPFFVRGQSMEPNFSDRQYLIVNELGYKRTAVHIFGKNIVLVEPHKVFARGDIVVFRAPIREQQYYIKRIIGLPGERVMVADGIVRIFNAEHPEGFVLDEGGYLPDGRKTGGEADVVLTDDQYYVLGDNRPASSDSRVFGPISKSAVMGRAALRAWPLNKIDTL